MDGKWRQHREKSEMMLHAIEFAYYLASNQHPLNTMVKFSSLLFFFAAADALTTNHFPPTTHKLDYQKIHTDLVNLRLLPFFVSSASIGGGGRR